MIENISRERSVLLRAEVGTRMAYQGDDWDFLAPEPEVFRQLLSMKYGEPLLEINHTYVKQCFYDWGGVDILPAFEWNGWKYFDEEVFWGQTFITEEGLRKPCLAHDAFIAWFCGLLHGGAYNDRYDEFIFKAVEQEPDEFKQSLIWAFGVDWAQLLEKLALEKKPKEALSFVDDLRGAVMWQNFCREGIFVAGPVLAHWWQEAKNHLRPPLPWIAFLGPDGSGKSTVIGGLRGELDKCRIKFQHVHWRPTVRKKMSDEPGPPLTDPHGEPARNVLFSITALSLLFVRWWLGYFVRLLHLRAKSHVILSDRYYRDLLVDQQRYLYGGPVWLARLLFRFFPKPDLTLVLLTDAETILARKKEVEKPELERQLKAYRALAESLGEKAVVIDVGQSVEEVIAETTRVVKDFSRSRTIRRRGGES